MIRVRGIGPVYWGIDHESTDAWSSYAFMVETTPPYRRSTWGHQFTVAGKGVHFGLCTRETDPKVIAQWEGEGLDVAPEEIREWRGPSNMQDFDVELPG
jgi:hypothetical protein